MSFRATEPYQAVLRLDFCDPEGVAVSLELLMDDLRYYLPPPERLTRAWLENYLPGCFGMTGFHLRRELALVKEKDPP